jgi:ATP-dependent protease ClpP protease subunit
MDNYEKATSNIIKLLEEDAEKPIDLILNSSGGDMAVGFAFYDFIKANRIILNTVGVGSIHSMAIIVFLTGTVRLVGNHALMLFHQPARNFKDSTSLRSLALANAEIEMISAWYSKIVERETSGNLPAEKCVEMQATEVTLSPTEMIGYRLAHNLYGDA